MNLSLQEIVQPLYQLGQDSQFFSPFQSPWNSPPQSPHRIMAGDVPPNANQANPPPPAWRARTPLNLAPPLHDLPPNPQQSLPKFDLGEGIYVDDHLHSFFLALEVLAVEHEDVVCRMFPHALKAKATSWYFGLHANSITD